MLTRMETQYRSQITFTSDFHELVSGNLKPDSPLQLSYDPQRIVPMGEPYIFGDPHRPILAHVRFGPASSESMVVLSSPGLGAAPDRDATGQGSMLKAKLVIPPRVDMVSIWFSYTRLDGTVVYDSDYGMNFNFRFPENDVTSLDTNVVLDSKTHISTFYVHLITIAAVEHVTVRLGRADTPDATNDELPLRESIAPGGDQKKAWAIDGVIVPTDTVISFKVYYWIGGMRFKDDNTGHYFQSPPRPHENVPAPPAALARAALAWK